MTTSRAKFKRMEQASTADWELIIHETELGQALVPSRILHALRGLDGIYDGFGVSQLTHALQTAARAEADNANDELILAGLCHDIGKTFSSVGHAAISAAILCPFVSEPTWWIVANHQAIVARRYAELLGKDPDEWHELQGNPHFDMAWKFVEEWDQVSFDPDYMTPGLDHFEPLVSEYFAIPRALRKK